MKNTTYDWNQFLSFSEQLYNDPFGNNDSATKYRIVVSRSYYAAFHYAKKFLKDFHLENSTIYGGEHQRVIRHFKEMKRKTPDFQRKCKRIGLYLDRLKTRRMQADYKDGYTFKNADGEYGIKQAHTIISSIDELKNYFN